MGYGGVWHTRGMGYEGVDCIPLSPASSPHQTQSLLTSRTKMSLELRPPDPTISEDYSLPKLGEDRMPPKMCKRWMHHEIEAMKETGRQSRSSAEHCGIGDLLGEKFRSVGYVFFLSS